MAAIEAIGETMRVGFSGVGEDGLPPRAVEQFATRPSMTCSGPRSARARRRRRLSSMPIGCASAIRGSSRLVLIVSLSKERQTGAADQRLVALWLVVLRRLRRLGSVERHTR